jgi:hypothetical protein
MFDPPMSTVKTRARDSSREGRLASIGNATLVVGDAIVVVFYEKFINRSFGLNDENNVCVYDRDFAAQWAKIFADDLASRGRATLEEWRGRGTLTKLREMIASLPRNQV